jgi:plasmid stabilization system protein ParE
MISIEWTSAARIDLEAIDDHWSEIDLALAETTVDPIEAVGRLMQDHASAGPVVASDDIRKWSVRETPYILIYRFTANRLEILRVRHDREDWLT